MTGPQWKCLVLLAQGWVGCYACVRRLWGTGMGSRMSSAVLVAALCQELSCYFTTCAGSPALVIHHKSEGVAHLHKHGRLSCLSLRQMCSRLHALKT